MDTSLPTATSGRKRLPGILQGNLGWIAVFLVLILLPFGAALLDHQSMGSMLHGQAGSSKFVQGLLIEIFILAIYAISYDLVLGIVGLLSFGHAMFFGVGAYLTGILLKNFNLPLLPTFLLVVAAGILQALLFGIVLPRVQGITFALVTLGIASVFYIVIQSNEVSAWTGADVGLQGVNAPAYLSPTDHRLNFYFLALGMMFIIYLLYRRFVGSPTGRVCIAIRENKSRARMLGYNTFFFELTALTIASVTAATAGMLHAMYSPIISPSVASLSFTVSALLMILIGGVGTLSGAMLGAAIYRLLEFFLQRYFGTNAGFMIGIIYVALVLFVPFGIVGTWQQKSWQVQAGWTRLRKLFQPDKESAPPKPY